CLELGPGNSYLNAYNLLMNGAKKVILVDKFPRYIKTNKQGEFFNKELNYIKQKYWKRDLFFIKNGKVDEKYIQFIEGDFEKINLKEKIDFVLTISVFEHIKNIGEVIAKLSSVMKKSGLMYHSIDLRDHYNFNNPFLFYKYSKKTWEKYLTKEGVSYTNRIRYTGFMKLFEEYGFEVINEKTQKYNLPIKISVEFDKKDENLNVGTIEVLLKRK
ncbi:MAG: methyltransferase domain-containing protein, partial [Candidatus Nanoarchaeia archaeon]|nr:methyltransferase domain-containing protein [Candidatus Nanoarchaeia archaeon]